jgi:hypothetical protein
MAFKQSDLSALMYANGFTLWQYKSTDAANTIDTAGYFNSASSMLRQNDVIIINASTGGTATCGLAFVNANSNGVVDIADITAIGSADAR